jgi:hypothetical protein
MNRTSAGDRDHDIGHALPTDFDNALPTDFGHALPALRDCFGPLRGPRNDRLR